MDTDDHRWCLVSHALVPGAGRVEYTLNIGENSIGRKRDADINLASLDVSREQCVIYVVRSSTTLALVDRESRNGTYVNGTKVPAHKSITLLENDSVGFGSNTTVEEKYKERCPFLVFRVVKKIPSIVFENMAKNRGKESTKRLAETAPPCVPAIKRIKAEHGIAAAPAPIGPPGSRKSMEVSSTSGTIEEPSGEGQMSSSGVRVSRSRSDGLVEFCVIDDDDDEPEPNAASSSSSVRNQPEKSKCSDQSTTQASLLAKSSDSTIQNTLNSDMETGTPSLRNSSSRTNDDTRSIQKDQSRYSSAAASSSKRTKKDPSPARHSSAKVELFKLPLIEVKKELSTIPLPVPSSPAPSNTSKSGDILTFSLISDDEDDDESSMMSSQMFIKTEPESQSLVIEEHIIDEDIYEIFDSDDESMFENHLSQSFSQSFMLPEASCLNEVEVPQTRKESGKKGDGTKTKDDTPKKKDDTIKGKKDSIRCSLPKDDSGTTRTSSDRALTSKKPSDPKSSSKMTAEETKTSSKKAKTPRTACKKPEPKIKDVPKSQARASSEEVTKLGKDHQESSKEHRSSADTLNIATTTSNQVDILVDKVKQDSKTKAPKKAVLIEPHSLPGKINKTVKPTNGTVLPTTKKRRVTFKDDLVEVKEYECVGNRKKLSTVPNHLLKEHPPKQPALQYNTFLLRSCQLITDICQWNLKWLSEFQMVGKDPPLVSYDPQPVVNRFNSFRDYYLTMVALIMHELWSEMCKTHLFQTESQKFSLFSGMIEHIEPNNDGRTMFCRVKTIISPSDMANPLPNAGDLVGIELLAPDKKRTHLYSSFGVVTRQYSRERLRPSRETNFLISNLAPDKSNIDTAVVCPIEVLFRPSKTHANNLTKDCWVRIRVYRNIMNPIKYFLALNKVSRSPLKAILVDPTKAVNKTSETRKEIRINGQEYLTTNLNQLQREAILGIANSLLTDESSINLIHGPPGTGKSSTIASLIVHLLPSLRKGARKGTTPKILLCAPSNTAIDELCLKLLEVRKKLREEEKFKLTRVGNIRMMHPKVADISSHSLALRSLTGTPDPESLETEMKLLDARIKAGENSLLGCHRKPQEVQRIKENIEKSKTRLAFYSKNLANIRSGRPPSKPDEDRKMLHQEECVFISGAEIIATTLSSSSSKILSDALSESSQFSLCIVDEATQATEPEVLIPLIHDIRHLVLVGDPLQLGPTVTSRFAKERNFEWSLYHRLMTEWKQYKGTPLYPLREQYRMHSEIVAFPSKTFYNSELKTPSYLKVALSFTPYQVISHSWPESAAEESNEKEGRFIVDLVQKLLDLDDFKRFAIGIIVPYQNQNRFIRKVIEDKRDQAFDNVVVNTIDSFQGQEKDLIILSCVRTKRIGFLSDKQRLNVALTRAKKCLLVVGNFQALKADEFWKAMLDDAKSRNRFVEANLNDRIAAGIVYSRLFAKKNDKVDRRRPHHSRT